MKQIFIGLLACLAAQQGFAQQAKAKIQFNSINNWGIITGENGGNITLQTINGLRFKNSWAIGLGTGFDPYRVASVPAFIDVRKYFGKGPSQFFIYADGGMNFTLHNNDYPKKWIGSNENAYTFKPSLYQEAGVGISRQMSKTIKLFISAGYSVKQFKYTEENSGIIIDFPPYTSSPTAYNFIYRRFSIKIGLEL
jgi:hypothetical protein